MAKIERTTWPLATLAPKHIVMNKNENYFYKEAVIHFV